MISPEDGTVYYAIGEDDQTAPEFDGTSQVDGKKWNTSIPTGTEAKAYYVWYKVVGDENHNDTDPVCVTATISRPTPITPTTYKINPPESSENGTVTVKPTSAAKGKPVTITATPDEDYEVDEITVTGKKGNPVEVTKNEDGTYTFNMPASEVTVSAAFKKTQEEPTPVEPKYDESHETCGQDTNCPMMNFTDLDMTEWYHDGVHFCLANGIMNGNGDGTFAPEGETTRAEIVQILYNMEGRPATEADLSGFADVDPDEWYVPAIQWAVANQIMEGNGDGTFEPDTPVTREQIAKILYGYAQFKGLDVSQGEDTNILDFTDAEEISDWAVPYVQWAVGAELINGRDEGDKGILLAPQEGAERAEVATLMMRFCLNFLAE